ncbi:MAG: hypothetical protein KJ561_05630 [Nanoarchaeota archaeon]|nr:hypothetical protein [Nanoarchaeota archaeon]
MSDLINYVKLEKMWENKEIELPFAEADVILAMVFGRKVFMIDGFEESGYWYSSNEIRGYCHTGNSFIDIILDKLCEKRLVIKQGLPYVRKKNQPKFMFALSTQPEKMKVVLQLILACAKKLPRNMSKEENEDKRERKIKACPKDELLMKFSKTKYYEHIKHTLDIIPHKLMIKMILEGKGECDVNLIPKIIEENQDFCILKDIMTMIEFVET